YPGPKIPKIGKERAAVLGEFGGLAFFIEKNTWDVRFKWGYRKCKYKEELKEKYIDLIEKVTELKSKGLAAAVYTQITDVEGEINGLLTYDRKKSKIHKSSLKKINQELIKT
ncbi:MAG: beta-galactosidase, partial [Candidatus Thorarchaeota archaeon]